MNWFEKLAVYPSKGRYKRPELPQGSPEEIVNGRTATGVFAAIEEWAPPTKSNPLGYSKFLVLKGDTRPIKDAIQAAGFRWNGQGWSTTIRFLRTNEKGLQILRLLGLSKVDQIIHSSDAEDGVPMAKTQDQQTQDASVEVPVTPTSKVLQQMQQATEEALSKTGNDRVKSILSNIDQQIEKFIEEIASGVDKESAGQFVKEYLHFAQKFREYSFHNTLLIYVQKPDAIKVAGAVQWRERFGREVRFEEQKNGISIFGPPQSKEVVPKSFNPASPPVGPGGRVLTEDDVKYSFVYYPTLTVYDYSQTVPLQGDALEAWKTKNTREPYTNQDWRRDPADETQELVDLYEAGVNFATAMNIDVQKAKMEAAMGGYSAGGKIRLNESFKGMQIVSTLIHEIAHEILHQGDRRSEARQELAKYREIDAEATAQVVLRIFGLASADTERYLALWKANGEDVKSRQVYIKEAANKIVQGVLKYMHGRAPKKKVVEQAVDQVVQPPATAKLIRTNMLQKMGVL